MFPAEFFPTPFKKGLIQVNIKWVHEHEIYQKQPLREARVHTHTNAHQAYLTIPHLDPLQCDVGYRKFWKSQTKTKCSPLLLTKCIHNCSRFMIDINVHFVHSSHSVQTLSKYFSNRVGGICSLKLKASLTEKDLNSPSYKNAFSKSQLYYILLQLLTYDNFNKISLP